MATLFLSDGTSYPCQSSGANVPAVGILAADTTMGGYMEVLTSSAYAGCMVLFTFPVIGTAGVFTTEVQKPYLSGVIARSLCDTPSNWESEGTVADYLKRHNIPAVTGLDTRALTRRLRDNGSPMIAGFCPDGADEAEVRHLMDDFKGPVGYPGAVDRPVEYKAETARAHVGVFDMGCSRDVVAALNARGISVTLLPPQAPLVLDGLQGLVIPDGPDLPPDMPLLEQINSLKEFAILALGTGFNWLAATVGGEIAVLPHAHRGDNLPVTDLRTDKTAITSQSHSHTCRFPESSEVTVTHRNLNDGTVEGFRAGRLLALQYKPAEQDGIWDEFSGLLHG